MQSTLGVGAVELAAAEGFPARGRLGARSTNIVGAERRDRAPKRTEVGKPQARYVLPRWLLGSRHLATGLLAIPLSTTMWGCASVETRFVTGLTAEQRAMARELPVYTGRLPEGSYEMLGPVTGLSCQIGPNESGSASEDGAMEELRRAAVGAGGTAVMGVECKPLTRGARNCFRAIECSGAAIVTTSADASDRQR